MRLTILLYSFVVSQSASDPSISQDPSTSTSSAATSTGISVPRPTDASVAGPTMPYEVPIIAVNPYFQSEALFSQPSAKDICKKRCRGGVSSLIKKGLGFASVVFHFTEGVVEGGVDSVVGAVEGIWSIATDPQDFVLNIVHAGENPKATALAIAQAISNYCTNNGNTNAESIGKCIGNAAGQIGMMLVGAGEARAASGVAKGAEVVGEEAEYAALLTGAPTCAELRRRNLFKRAPTVPCVPPAVGDGLAQGGGATVDDQQVSQLTNPGTDNPAQPLTAAQRKAQRAADYQAAVTAKAAERAEKAKLLLPDPDANGLPTSTTFNGAPVDIEYAQSFNMKHFQADRGGLGGGTTNTVIKDPSQVRFGTPVEGKSGTGANQRDVLIFTSTEPVDVDVFQKDTTTGQYIRQSSLKKPLSVSGILKDGKVLINHFEAAVVIPNTNIVIAVVDDFGQDASAASLADPSAAGGSSPPVAPSAPASPPVDPSAAGGSSSAVAPAVGSSSPPAPVT